MAQLPTRARRYSIPPADPHSVRSVERKQAGVGAAAAAPGHGFGLLCGSELGTVYATSRHRSWPSCPPKNGLTASDLLPVARTGSAEGSRQGEGKQVGRARGRFFGPLWPAVWDLLAVSLDQYVPYDISRRWKRCSTRSERAWVSETPNPASLRLVERPAFRARAPIRSTRIESKATKQASKATGVRAFYWLGRGTIVSRQGVPGKVTYGTGGAKMEFSGWHLRTYFSLILRGPRVKKMAA